ncbi:MAG: polysaccharide biosynthesis tyrosine autokinase [Planctomycetota bacterium]
MQRDLQRSMANTEMVTNQVGVPVAPMPPAQQNVLTPKFVLNVLRRWWKMSTLLGLIVAAAAGFISYFTYVPTFEATTWLRFRDNYIIYANNERDRSIFVLTQRELIKSPPIIAEALAKPEIASLPIFEGITDPLNWLSDRIVASSQNGSDLFKISLQSSHRESVAKVVNAVREAYLANLNTDVVRQNDSTLHLLEAERTRRASDMERDRNRLRSLQKELANTDGGGGIDNPLNERQIQLLSPTASLKSEITKAEVDLVLEEAELKVIKESMTPDADLQVSPEAIDQEIETDKGIVKLLAKLGDKEAAREEMLKFAKPGSPSLAKIDAEVAQLTQELETEKKRLRPEAAKLALTNFKKRRAQEMQKLEESLARSQKRVEILKEKLETARKDAQENGQASLEIKFLAEDLERKDVIYGKIVERIEQIKTESRTNGRVSTLQEALEPKEPIDKGPVPRALLFAFAAFMLPFSGFFLWELRSRRVADAEDFAEATNLRVVGEISTLPIRSRFLPTAAKRFEESLSRFEESIDYLRTAILIARHQRTVQSLVVCSAASREGKSTVSAHLASSLARGISGRVLLVDADMRRPHLHRLLDQDPENGLVDYLAGRTEFGDVIRNTWVERLDFVAAGILDTPVGILLANDRFERFLRQAERTYEFIVIDVPPILPVSEGLVIAKCADGAIFCGLRDVSTVANIARACEKLRAAGVNIFGAVFNGVPPREYGASGYYYYRIPTQSAQGDAVPNA